MDINELLLRVVEHLHRIQFKQLIKHIKLIRGFVPHKGNRIIIAFNHIKKGLSIANFYWKISLSLHNLLYQLLLRHEIIIK